LAGFGLVAQTKQDWDLLYMNSSTELQPAKIEVFEQTGLEVTAAIDQHLDSVAKVQLKSNRISGFRILLYSGNEREESARARENAYRIFYKADLYTSYQAPTFKVKLGDYYQWIDAFLDLKKLESVFPQAVIVQEIVNLKP
jgi:hypothetical protein